MIIFEPKVYGFEQQHAGYIPEMLSEDDTRSASEQINANYVGGWSPRPSFEMLPNGHLAFPGDDELRLLAEAKLRDEVIRLYQYAWVAIIQPDGSYEVARID